MIKQNNRNAQTNANTTKRIAIAVSISAAIASLVTFACIVRKKTRTFEIKAVKRAAPVSTN